MKLLKRIVIALFSVLLLIFIGGWIYIQTLKPKYNGELSIEALAEEVVVHYDDIGVPHIKAKSQEDAYLALGYLHAQERLWQMELIRRIAPGRLSEILGKDMLQTDMFFSGLGIEEAGLMAIENIDKSNQSFILAQKYLDGVNQFIENGTTPLEFTMLGIEKETYTIKDIYNVYGYMAFSFAIAHKTDPLLTDIKERLGADYLNEFLSSSNQNLTLNPIEINPIKANLSQAVNDIMETLPVSSFMGSNSWVIGPEKTKNGKVIFENDPHISYAQPSVWYQNHIKTPNYEMYGFNIALMPFPLLGHNRQYAYGLTMFANDDLNFYTEENHPDNPLQFKTSDGYKPYDLIEKNIQIKDEPDTTFVVKVSQHGPIMNDLIDHIEEDRPIAMYWIYTQLENLILDINYGISHATSLKDFKKAAEQLHAPGLNMMYGDAEDNIAWFASAKLYELRDSLSTKTYLDGTTGDDEILSFLPFEDNPQAINPSHHYVYSANHQPDSINGKLYPGYYQPQDRSKRIVELLEEKDDFTKEDVAKMSYDVTSAEVTNIIKQLTKHIELSDLSKIEEDALLVLKNWDAKYSKTAVAPTIFNRFLFEFLSSTYQDEMGDRFQLFINSQLQDQVLLAQIKNENSVWWDNVSTVNNEETREEIIQTSYKEAIAFLQNQLGDDLKAWHWKRVISVEHEHAFGKVGGLLRSFFNVGPFETIGGNEVINNQIFKLDSTGIYKVTSGPSTRRIVDFSDVENSLSILPTGQSGNVFSKHYKDQSQSYLDGDFFKMLINTSEIETLNNVLVLKPKSN
jgi:penicillin amidase